MKSNEQFIASIYEKAEKLQEEEIEDRDNVIRTDSYSPKSKIQKRIKRGYGFIAGAAACFACVTAIYASSRILNSKKQMGTESRTSQRDGQTVSIRENDLPETRQQSEPQALSKYLHCSVGDMKLSDGIYHIQIVLEDQTQGALLIPEETLNPAIQTGKEVVLNVYDPDKYGNYVVVPESAVYVYSSMENGEKVFTSEDHTVLYEHELVQ